MIIQWHVLLCVWSLKLIKVSLAEDALSDIRELWEPNQSSYYIVADADADADSNSIKPSEERTRFQRSFLKKFWKNLFGVEECVSCCKTDNCQAGEGDIYQAPPTVSNMPCSPLPLPLTPFDPLGILQPFFKPMDFNCNEPNNNCYVNNCGGSGTNSNEDNGSNKYINDGKTDVTYEKPNVDCSYDGYVKPELNPMSNQAPVVYQPIIYVSPQYQPASPTDSSPYNSNHGGAATYPEHCSQAAESPCNSQPPPSAAIPTQPCRCYGGSHINPIDGMYPPKMPDPIILTAADQPYRNCPELFTEYCNRINNIY